MDYPPTRQRLCRATPLMCLLIVPVAFAQPTVDLEVQTDKPYVNETIAVKIHVRNAGDAERPVFPELPNCRVRYIGPESEFRQQFDPATGRTVTIRRQSFTYGLVASKAGELTIPPIPVVVDGKTLETKPYRLTIREVPQSPTPGGSEPNDQAADGSDLLLAEITCARRKLYVGQRANFTLTVWIKPAEFNRDRLELSEMLRYLKGSFGPFDTQDVRSRQVRRPTPNGRTQLYYLIELPAEFIVDQPGPLTFDAVSLALDYPLKYARSFFNDVRVYDKERVRVRPTIAVPDVHPLPTEGRPASFSGAVGRYDLSVVAVPTNVRVGDPIELIIDITGDLVETLPGPKLTSIPQLVDDFRVPAETLAGTVAGNRKRFTQVIRAKRSDVQEIPPIEFAYFDPDAERYVIARSDPIPLFVSAVEQLDAADLTALGPEPLRDQTSGVQARDSLRGIKTRESELLATVRPVSMTQVTLTTFLPPLAFLCIWGCARLTRARQNEAALRRRGALRNAERRISAAMARRLAPDEFHRELEAAVAGYLADRLNEPPARFLGHAAVDFLQERDVGRELVERCAELVELCERAAYAGGAEGDTSLADLARHCIIQLERERL